MPVKTYKYGCYKLKPETEQYLSDELHKAHTYYNRLVELENQFRKNNDDIRCALSPEYAAARRVEAAADAALKEAVDKLLASKSRNAEVVDRSALQAACATARSIQKAARDVSNAVRKIVHQTPEWVAARDLESSAHLTRRKALYAEFSTLWWGTKNAMVDSMEAAYADTQPFNQVSFRQWSRNGRLVTQVMNGGEKTDILGCTSNQVQIQREPGKKKRAICRIRMGSVEGRKPFWVEVPIAYHRDLPDGSVVKTAMIVRRQGYNYYPGSNRPPQPYDEWSVNLAIHCPEVEQPVKQGVVAVDVGWRVKDDRSLRVAYWADNKGRTGELILPVETVALFFEKRRAQGVRDTQFNSMRDELVGWLKANQHPEWLSAATDTLAQWRSQGRLLHLISSWVRFAGDGEIYTNLLAWRRQDVLTERDFVLRPRKAQNIRLDLYRNFAARLGREYATIVVEKMNVAEMRRGPLPESDEADFVPKTYRDAASSGLLLSTLLQQGRAEVVKIPAAGTTKVCHVCGSEENFDRQKLDHRCGGCGVSWDQDYNAAMNLLARFAGRTDAGQDGPAPAKKKRPVRRNRRSAQTRPATEAAQ